MKSIQQLRIIFVMIVAIGSIALLFVAAKVSAENIAVSNPQCVDCSSMKIEPTSTEFIFFETVTRYLVIAINR